MGIRGLKSFVECNPHLLSDHELHDTYLLIDGSNLLYILYFDTGDINFHNGGDYDKYYNILHTIFSAFKKCNITPVVIFDGGYTVDERKKKTTINRATNRNFVVTELAAGLKPRTRALPILAQEVMYEVLRELNVTFAQCDFEADNEIAVLARYLNCPILSQDSDFYIFDVPSGFIPIDTIYFEDVSCKNNPEISCMRCQMFYVDNFMSYFPNFKKSLLPIFSTLSGNDYVDARIFESFYSQLPNIPKFKSKKSKKNLIIGKRFSRMIALLQWLENMNTEEAIGSIKKCLKKTSRDTAEQLMKQAISIYEDNTSSCFEYVMKMLGRCPNSAEEIVLANQDHLSLPDWFMELFREGIFPSFLLNCVCIHRLMLLTQMEAASIDSTYTCSLFIRRHIYCILKQISDFDGTVSEYMRCRRRVEPHIVSHEATYLSSFGDEYKLNGTVEEGRCIYFQMLGVSSKFLEKVPSELALMFAVFPFWINNASPLVKEQHLNAIVLSLLYFGLIIPVKNDQKAVLMPNDDLLFNNNDLLTASKAVCKTNALLACKNLQKYFTKETVYNLKTVHNYCQLQTCLLYALYLSRLLLSGQPLTTKFTLFNGSFIHNVCYDLEGRSNPDLFISELLGRESDIERLFFLIRGYILMEVDTSRIIKHGVMVSRGKSRKKRKSASKSKDSCVT